MDIRRIDGMELLLVFLSTAVGTVVGVGAAVLMMSRRNRAPAVGDAAVRTQLQNTEWALASAGRDVEDLRKQLVEREGVHDDLQRTREQLAAIMADQARQSGERAAAELRVTELAEEAAALRARLDAGDAAADQTAEFERAVAAAERRPSELVDETVEMRAKLDAG